VWRIAESFRFSIINMLLARVAYPTRDDSEAPTTVKREQKSAA